MLNVKTYLTACETNTCKSLMGLWQCDEDAFDALYKKLMQVIARIDERNHHDPVTGFNVTFLTTANAENDRELYSALATLGIMASSISSGALAMHFLAKKPIVDGDVYYNIYESNHDVAVLGTSLYDVYYNLLSDIEDGVCR